MAFVEMEVEDGVKYLAESWVKDPNQGNCDCQSCVLNM